VNRQDIEKNARLLEQAVRLTQESFEHAMLNPSLSRAQMTEVHALVVRAVSDSLSSLTVATAVCPAVAVSSTVIIRQILEFGFAEGDAEREALSNKIDDFVTKLEAATVESPNREDRIKRVVSEAIAEANTLPVKLRGYFVTIALGILSTMSTDALQDAYTTWSRGHELSAPLTMPGTEFKVIGDGLRLRSGADANATILGLIPVDSRVTFYDQEGSWMLVRYSPDRSTDLVGWVYEDYISQTLDRN